MGAADLHLRDPSEAAAQTDILLDPVAQAALDELGKVVMALPSGGSVRLERKRAGAP